MARILREVDLRSRLSLEGLKEGAGLFLAECRIQDAWLYRQVYSAKAGRTCEYSSLQSLGSQSAGFVLNSDLA